MRPAIDQYIELLERRVSLLRRLAREFLDCRVAFVAMNLDGIYSHIGEQEELCRQIRSLDVAIDVLMRACSERSGAREPGQEAAEGSAPEWATRLSQLTQELGEAQGEVQWLNRVHAAMLRRSQRTLTMLTNFLGNYAMTYAQPVANALPAPLHAGGGRSDG